MHTPGRPTRASTLIFALAASGALLAAHQSLAQTAPSADGQTTYKGVLSPRPRGNGYAPGIVWANTPTTLQVTGAMPFTATSAGRTRVSCAIKDDGHLTDCRVTAVWPAAQGFSKAALSLIPYFQLSDRTVGDAKLNGARVLFGIDVFNDQNSVSKIPGACPQAICGADAASRAAGSPSTPH